MNVIYGRYRRAKKNIQAFALNLLNNQENALKGKLA